MADFLMISGGQQKLINSLKFAKSGDDPLHIPFQQK